MLTYTGLLGRVSSRSMGLSLRENVHRIRALYITGTTHYWGALGERWLLDIDLVLGP